MRHAVSATNMRFRVVGMDCASCGPALANVGIAIDGGTAALQGRVVDVAALGDLLQRMMASNRKKIAIALGLNAVFLFLVTSIARLTGLWPAILADTGATGLVKINALRLLAVSRT